MAHVKDEVNPDDPVEFAIVMFMAMVLTINAGFVNGCAVLSKPFVTVSHMTGNTTQLAVLLTGERFFRFEVVSSIYFSFIAGAALAGALVPEDPVKFGRRFGFILMLEACMLGAAGLIGAHDPESNWWWALAAAACGLQNASFTKFTGNFIRPTHMTGVHFPNRPLRCPRRGSNERLGTARRRS